MAPLTVLRTIALSLLAGLSSGKPNCPKTITRDVAIIGGGASGAHAAVRLREDFGKSVIVVEKKNRLVRIPLTRATPAARSTLSLPLAETNPEPR